MPSKAASISKTNLECHPAQDAAIPRVLDCQTVLALFPDFCFPALHSQRLNATRQSDQQRADKQSCTEWCPWSR